MAEQAPAPAILDAVLLKSLPLPPPPQDADKNSRGRVLCLGGSARVPGGIMLTAEAALRAGAGKVQIATSSTTALAIGVAMPELAVFGLSTDEDGEIQDATDIICRQADICDALIVGPAMSRTEAAGNLVDKLLAYPSITATLVLDAAALMSLRSRYLAVQSYPHPKILTPHAGELQALLGWEDQDIAANRPEAAKAAALAYQAIVVVKGATTWIAQPDGQMAFYEGGGVGLATGGSGDVLAGIVGGLASRGAPAWVATLWGVWLHGQAGRLCAKELGPLGFLSRELLVRLPHLMANI